jgi:hypothetical protein
MKKNLLLDLGIFFLVLDPEGTGVAGGVVTVVEASPLTHAVLYLWHSAQVKPSLPLLPVQVRQRTFFDRHLLQGGSMSPACD